MRRILAGLLLFFGAIILLSAVLSPWAFWAWDNFFPGSEPFRRVFNRVMMVSAVFLLWPLARFWKIKRFQEMGIGHFKVATKAVLTWFACGVVTIAVLFFLQMIFGERSWKDSFTWARLPGFLGSALLVGFLEEMLFRGLLFLALFRVAREYASKVVLVAVMTSLFYAVSHYIKAANPTDAITWLSGWSTWKDIFMDFGDLRMLALRLVCLFLVGLVLCALAYRHKTVWACIGLHAGWVFGLKTLNQTTEWTGGTGSWWFQADVLSGTSAEVLLLAILVFIVWRIKNRDAVVG